jgi:hypothetical protein
MRFSKGKPAVHIGCKAAQPQHYRRPALRSTSPFFLLGEWALAAPAKFETEIKRRIPHEVHRTRLSLVPQETQIRPVCADFRQTPQRISDLEDWVAERGGFEPPEPQGLT